MRHSIRFRFGFTLFANCLKAIVSFGTGIVVARGLGPEEYGSMIFLLGTYAAVRQLVDMGTSTAFFTFLSQRQRSKRFVALYFGWLGIEFFFPLLVVGILFPNEWVQLIWKGEERQYVILAFLATYMQSVLWTTVVQMGESQRLTKMVQAVALTVALVNCLMIFGAWWGDWLSVRAIFILTIIEWGIASLVVIKQLRFQATTEEDDAPRAVFAKFLSYCLPLVPYAWLSFAYEFVDRWLLQTYAGSIQQAYYSVALQFSAIAAIATSSILNIFWKEIAEAHNLENRHRVASLYRRVTRGLFFVTAISAGFLAPWAESILRLTVGEDYVGGAITLMVMFFYTLHQSMGQINSAVAYATERVSVYVKFGMVFMATSIVVTYFVLAPGEASVPGLNLGSLGLAAKMVLMQIVFVNGMAWYLSTSLGVKFDWLFQPVLAMVALGGGFVTKHISQAIAGHGNYLWLEMFLSGAFYILVIIVLMSFMPSMAGLRRIDVRNIFARVIRLNSH